MMVDFADLSGNGMGVDVVASSPFIPKYDYAFDVRKRGAEFKGEDVTYALMKTIDDADKLADGKKCILLPRGIGQVSQTIQLPPSIGMAGNNRIGTQLYKNKDFGNLLTLGNPTTSYQASLDNLWLYHDYGTGGFTPNYLVPNFTPTTQGAIVQAWYPSHGSMSNVMIYGGKGGLNIFGGVDYNFYNVRVGGVYDPTVPQLQETLSAFYFDGDNTRGIPTNMNFVGCAVANTISPTTRTITWPGGFTSNSTVQNIGPKDGLYVRSAEGMIWNGGYIGGCGDNGVRLFGRPGAELSAIAVVNCFMDACHNAQLMLDNSGGAPSVDVLWSPHQANGQLNGFCGVSDAYSNLSTVSCTNLMIGPGSYRAFVGPAFNLKRVGKMTVDAAMTARWWNGYKFYNNNAQGLGFDACFRLADTNLGAILLNGNYGGGPDGIGGLTGYDAVVARRNNANAIRGAAAVFGEGTSSTFFSNL